MVFFSKLHSRSYYAAKLFLKTLFWYKFILCTCGSQGSLYFHHQESCPVCTQTLWPPHTHPHTEDLHAHGVQAASGPHHKTTSNNNTRCHHPLFLHPRVSWRRWSKGTPPVMGQILNWPFEKVFSACPSEYLSKWCPSGKTLHIHLWSCFFSQLEILKILKSHFIFYYFFFSASPCGMQDLSFQTRDLTNAPCTGSAES